MEICVALLKNVFVEIGTITWHHTCNLNGNLLKCFVLLITCIVNRF